MALQKAGAFSAISGGQVIVSTPSCTGGVLNSSVSVPGMFVLPLICDRM